MDLQISIRISGHITILDLQGRATIGVSNDLLRSHLRNLIDSGSCKLLLNLADLVQVDSSSIGTIVGTFFTLRRTGGSLKLLHAHGRVKKVLEVMRLLGAIPTFDDESEALASFREAERSASGEAER